MANTVSEGDLEAGDVIYRLIDGMQLANHYGVYVGDGAVIHLSRELGLRRMTFEEFAKNYEVSKKSFSNTLPRDDIVEMARYYFKHPDEWGEYSLVFNNCEHFATYCATGNKSSGQVQKTVAAGAVGIGIGILAVGLFGGVSLFASSGDRKKKYVDRGPVIESSFDEFSEGKRVWKDSTRTRSREETVRAAKYYSDNPDENSKYNLVSNNCEHFVTKCATGVSQSRQVQSVVGVADGVAKASGYGNVLPTLNGFLESISDPLFTSDSNEKSSSSNSLLGDMPLSSKERIFKLDESIFHSRGEKPQLKSEGSSITCTINPEALKNDFMYPSVISQILPQLNEVRNEILSFPEPASISDLVQRHRSDNSNSLEMSSFRMPPEPERSFIDTFLFKESPKEASGRSLMDQMWLNKFP